MSAETIGTLAGAILVFLAAYLNYRVSQMNSDSAQSFKQGLKEGKSIASEITSTAERVQAGYEGILQQQRGLNTAIENTLDRTLTMVEAHRQDVRDAHHRLLDIIQEKW